MKAAFGLLLALALGAGGYLLLQQERLPPLSPEGLAYAHSMARYEPLLALAGTEPEALRRAADALEETRFALAALQTEADDAALIRSALYPAAFLRSLAAAEEARTRFAASGSAKDASRYDGALTEALAALQESVSAFKRGFEAAVPADIPPYQVPAGTVSRASMLRAIEEMRQRASELAREHERRQRCAQERAPACEEKQADASLPAPATPSAAPAGLPQLAEEVLGIRAEVIGDPALRELPVVALDTSACLSAFPAPHYMLVREKSSGPLAPPLDFIGDIMLYPVSASPQGPVVRYLSERGASYYPPSPIAFYQCPDIGSDLGRVFSSLRVQERLGSAPAPLVSESAALGLLRDALQEDAAGLSELALMVRNRSARFDALVSEVAAFGRNDAQVKRAGIPIDTTALYYFYVKSGFPSLYLGHNASVTGGRDVSVFESGGAKELWEQLVLWSAIRDATPEEEIVEDMRVFFTMHDDPGASVRGSEE